MSITTQIPDHVAGGTAKRDDTTRILDVFSYPGIYDLGAVCDQVLAPAGSPGRSSPYPATVFLAVLVVSRVTASLPEAIKALRNYHWPECREIYAEATGEVLPLAAPNRDQVQYFRKKLLAAAPHVLADLQAEFQAIAVNQARLHGNLHTDRTPDWSDPDHRNLVYGDGTELTPFSGVTVRIHPLTGERFTVGSRARSADTARVQKTFTDFAADGKTHLRGINFVSLHTWTRYGNVVLGTGPALGAEQWSALDLLDSVAEHARGGVHTLLYDRVFTGWLVDYCMGRHRIQVINRAAGRKKASNGDARDEPLVPDTAVLREAAEYGAVLGADDVRYSRSDMLADLFYSRRPLPVGLCLYPRLTRDDVADPGQARAAGQHQLGFDVVYSRFYNLATRSHTTADGECEHNLFVDDGGLHVVEPDPVEEHLVKVGTAEAVSCEPVHRAGALGTRTTWRLPCAAGAWETVTEWTPSRRRYHPGQERDRPDKQETAMNALRPISRSDHVRFTEVGNRRNLSESYNNWMKDRLPHKGRAASLTLAGQELDFLCAAILKNVLTWATAEAAPT